ncbi:MAG: DUF433 domain-containing protein [Gammaproteobacteria bacterium]
MAKAKHKRADVREMPAYSVGEAAHYLNVAQPTLRYWAGQANYPALITPAGTRPLAFSFLNIVELHVLAAIRRTHEISMPKVRDAIDYLEKTVGSSHPLISRELQTDGLDLFIDEYGKLVNINRAGQQVIREVLEAALRRIERDRSGIPIKLYPFTRSSIEDAPAVIVINPALSAGRPVLAGTGIATEVIADRYKAGDSIKSLARDYERTAEEIEEAIRCELQAAA